MIFKHLRTVAISDSSWLSMPSCNPYMGLGSSVHYEAVRDFKALQDYPKQENWAHVSIISELKDYLLSIRLKKAHDEFVCKSVKGEMLPYETYNRRLVAIGSQIGHSSPLASPWGRNRHMPARRRGS